MFTPGAQACTRWPGNARGSRRCCARLVSTLGSSAANSNRNVLDVSRSAATAGSSSTTTRCLQPQGIGVDLGPWIGEVTRRNF